LERAVRCVVDWVRRKRIFVGVRGTGQYTPEQDTLYHDIQVHLQNYRPVCLGTFEYPGAPEPGYFGGSGEHMSKGLAGPHAYAVLDCLQRGAVKYVRVHNPWGHTGRGYTFAPPEMRPPRSTKAELRLYERNINPTIPANRKEEQAYETGEGTFWLELSDLTKRFQALYTCSWTPDAILGGRRRAGWPV
jgi:hypothetical protein